MLARGDDDAELRAGIDIDVWVNTALAYESEIVQSTKEGRANFSPFAYQHQHFGIPQAFSQCIDILHVIIPDLDFMACELLEALKRAKRVEIIVKNGYLHTTMATSQWVSGR